MPSTLLDRVSSESAENLIYMAHTAKRHSRLDGTKPSRSHCKPELCSAWLLLRFRYTLSIKTFAGHCC